MTFDNPQEEIEHLLRCAEERFGSSEAMRRIVHRHGATILTGRASRDATLPSDKQPIGFRASVARRPAHG